MAIHNITGKEGEELARRYLEANDYLILETNWRIGHLEADIIAYKDNRIVFVEVKTRSEGMIARPMEAVDRQKQRHRDRHAAQLHVPQHAQRVHLRRARDGSRHPARRGGVFVHRRPQSAASEGEAGVAAP